MHGLLSRFEHAGLLSSGPKGCMSIPCREALQTVPSNIASSGQVLGSPDRASNVGTEDEAVTIDLTAQRDSHYRFSAWL